MAAKKLAPKIYVVTDKLTGDARLVEAVSKAGAVNHVVANNFTASVATQQQLVDAVRAGVEIEKSAKEDEPQADQA